MISSAHLILYCHRNMGIWSCATVCTVRVYTTYVDDTQSECVTLLAVCIHKRVCVDVYAYTSDEIKFDGVHTRRSTHVCVMYTCTYVHMCLGVFVCMQACTCALIPHSCIQHMYNFIQ